jgi:hypothetical protein
MVAISPGENNHLCKKINNRNASKSRIFLNSSCFSWPSPLELEIVSILISIWIGPNAGTSFGTTMIPVIGIGKIRINFSQIRASSWHWHSFHLCCIGLERRDPAKAQNLWLPSESL